MWDAGRYVGRRNSEEKLQQLKSYHDPVQKAL